MTQEKLEELQAEAGDMMVRFCTRTVLIRSMRIFPTQSNLIATMETSQPIFKVLLDNSR